MGLRHVSVAKVTNLFSTTESVRDIPEIITDQTPHFFEQYKDLEKCKLLKVEGWGWSR